MTGIEKATELALDQAADALGAGDEFVGAAQDHETFAAETPPSLRLERSVEGSVDPLMVEGHVQPLDAQLAAELQSDDAHPALLGQLYRRFPTLYACVCAYEVARLFIEQEALQSDIEGQINILSSRKISAQEILSNRSRAEAENAAAAADSIVARAEALKRAEHLAAQRERAQQVTRKCSSKIADLRERSATKAAACESTAKKYLSAAEDIFGGKTGAVIDAETYLPISGQSSARLIATLQSRLKEIRSRKKEEQQRVLAEAARTREVEAERRAEKRRRIVNMAVAGGLIAGAVGVFAVFSGNLFDRSSGVSESAVRLARERRRERPARESVVPPMSFPDEQAEVIGTTSQKTAIVDMKTDPDGRQRPLMIEYPERLKPLDSPLHFPLLESPVVPAVRNAPGSGPLLRCFFGIDPQYRDALKNAFSRLHVRYPGTSVAVSFNLSASEWEKGEYFPGKWPASQPDCVVTGITLDGKRRLVFHKFLYAQQQPKEIMMLGKPVLPERFGTDPHNPTGGLKFLVRKLNEPGYLESPVDPGEISSLEGFDGIPDTRLEADDGFHEYDIDVKTGGVVELVRSK